MTLKTDPRNPTNTNQNTISTVLSTTVAWWNFLVITLNTCHSFFSWISLTHLMSAEVPRESGVTIRGRPPGPEPTARRKQAEAKVVYEKDWAVLSQWSFISSLWYNKLFLFLEEGGWKDGKNFLQSHPILGSSLSPWKHKERMINIPFHQSPV